MTSGSDGARDTDHIDALHRSLAEGIVPAAEGGAEQPERRIRTYRRLERLAWVSRESRGSVVVSSRVVRVSMGIVLALMASSVLPASAPRRGGTIAVTSPSGDLGDDPLARGATEAAATALGMRGFTILNDPAHAAYIAEVVASRTEVGTSVERGRAGRTLATGAGVNIPLSGGKSVLAPLQRIEVEIRIRGRGDQLVFWHGAAVTVRSADVRNGGVDRLALELSQAALSSYPTQTEAAISVP